jgi:hypothetical protein
LRGGELVNNVWVVCGRKCGLHNLKYTYAPVFSGTYRGYVKPRIIPNVIYIYKM